ncbi:ribonucleotide-diphosphate reductase subunit beta [Candidatus Uhrbacteria bacterium]|nr:ribonucleotide-diphosphate reductase subunit beta [Candidatus Uhrbacteria bacterium]
MKKSEGFKSEAKAAAEAVWSYVTSVKSVRRSDGRIEEFDTETLEGSIRSGFEAAGLHPEREHARIQGVMQNAIQRLQQSFDGHTIPETQDVKEAVGASLIDGDLFDVAKHYLSNDMNPRNAPAHTIQALPVTHKRVAKPAAARRRRLPDERQSITHKFEIGAHTGYVTVGLYEDGKPGEVFITMSKEGSTLAGLLDALATSVSIGLQYGVPLKTLVGKFSHVRFEPSGFTQNPNIRMAKSVVDYIFRWLGHRFPDTEPEALEEEGTEASVATGLSQPSIASMPLTGASAILTPRKVYKPFEYPHYFEYFTKQNQAHWMPTEVPMENDIVDYKNHLTPAESSLIVNILRFFTQSDIEVNNNYNTRLIPVFPKPEIKMMLSSFAQMESIHVWAYSYLNDSLGLPEKEYSAFLEYESMRKKYDYIQSFDVRSVEDLAVNLAVFGGFIEGVSLFSSFAILMNFPRLGKLKGVGQIVSWSIRDESLHSKAVCQLFRDLVTENKHIWTNDLQQTLYSACRDMVNLEDAFIDTCFAMGDVPGLKPDEVKQYIRYIADRRLNDLGLDALYNLSNPLGWLDVMINAKEHTNFFENRATEYAKGAIVEDWNS